MMKSWRSLIQKIEGWRYRYQHRGSSWWAKNSRHKTLSTLRRNSNFGQSGNKQQQGKLRDLLAMLALSVIVLTSVVGYRFYNQPQLTVGKISPLTITAPYSAEFEDTKTTSERRKEVQTGIVPILKQDPEITQEIKRKLGLHLQHMS